MRFTKQLFCFSVISILGAARSDAGLVNWDFSKHWVGATNYQITADTADSIASNLSTTGSSTIVSFGPGFPNPNLQTGEVGFCSFGTSGWTGTTLADAINKNQYITFTVTAASGFNCNIDSIKYMKYAQDYQDKELLNFTLMSSVNGFAAGNEIGTKSDTLNYDTVTTILHGHSHLQTVEFRLYIWGPTINQYETNGFLPVKNAQQKVIPGFALVVYGAVQSSVGIKMWSGAAGDNRWGNPLNWVGDSLPSATDTALFTTVSMPPCSLDAPVTVGGIRLITGSLVAGRGGNDYPVTTNKLEALGGAFDARGAAITVNGNCTVGAADSLFKMGTSTVILGDNGSLSNPTYSNRFYNLAIAASSKTITLTSNISVEHILTFSGGTVTQGSSQFVVQWYAASGSTLGVVPSTVMDFKELDLLCDVDSLTLPAFGAYPNLVVTRRLTGTTSIGCAAGGIKCQLLDLHAAGDGSDEAVNFNSSGQPVTCTGLVVGNVTTPSKCAVSLTGSSVTVNGDVTLNSAAGSSNSLSLGSTAVTVNDGSWINNGVAVAPGTSTVTFTNSVSGKIVNSTGQFNNVVLNGASGLTVTTNGLEMAGLLTISSGTLNSGASLSDSLGSVMINGGTLNFTAPHSSVVTAGDFTVKNGNTGTLGNLTDAAIVVGGNASLSGTNGTTLLSLAGTAPWTINAAKSLSASFASLADCQATGVTGDADTTCLGDNAGNTNWIFDKDNIPKAGFGVATTVGIVPLTVQFFDSSKGKVTSRKWYFGDSATSTDTNPVHTFTAVGTYSVKLVVSGPMGTDSTTITNCVQVDSAGGNTVIISGRYLSSSMVAITCTGYKNLVTTFPYSADSLKFWYDTTGTYPSTVNPPSIYLGGHKLSDLMNDTQSSFTDTFSVVTANPKLQETYGFMDAVHWTISNTYSPFLPRNGAMVKMYDTTTVTNNLVVSAQYHGGDSVNVTFDNTASIDTNLIDTVFAWYGLSAGLTDTMGTKWFSAAAIRKIPGQFTFAIYDSSFSKLTGTVYLAVEEGSKDGRMSPLQTTSFTLGVSRPANPLTVQAFATGPGTIDLRWPSLGGQKIDSVRIWCDTLPIPLSYEVTRSVVSEVYASPASTLDSVTGLNPLTKYYFGAQVYQNGLWSYITDSSSASATTAKGDTTTVMNTVTISSAFFDSSTNTIKVIWSIHHDSTDTVKMLSGATSSLDSLASQASPSLGDSISLGYDTTEINISKSIVFDTTYYVWIWLRAKTGSKWTAPTPTGIARVRTPSTGWQVVTLDVSDTGATSVQMLNNNVALRTGTAWATYSYSDTLAFCTPPPPPGCIVASTCFKFSNGTPIIPFTFGIKCLPLPANYNITEVRVYSFDTLGNWYYQGPDSVDPIGYHVFEPAHSNESFRLPFILLIDTVAPQIQITSDTGAAVSANAPVVMNYKIIDNIKNVAVTHSYSQAGDAPVGHTASSSADSSMTIPAGSVTTLNGVRALITVNDGRNVATVNVSRQVLLDSADRSSTQTQWIPFWTTANLDKMDLASSLSLLGGSPAKYDPTKFRIMRWVGGNNDPTLDANWVEYSLATKDTFTLKPGLVYWLKSLKAQQFNLGPGRTTSLKDTVSLVIPAKQFEDIALPFQFDMGLGDILAATGPNADSLEFYKWASQQDGSYTASAVYIEQDPSLDSKDSVLTSGDAYTIYNCNSSDIILRVPPISLAMDSVSLAKAQKVAAANGWGVQFSADVQGTGSVGSVFLGYRGDLKRDFFAPVAPSLQKVRVAMQDPSSGNTFGGLVLNTFTNGTASRLAFTNNSKQNESVTIRLVSQTALPTGVLVKVLDPKNNQWQDPGAGQLVEVPAGTTQYTWVAAGNASFLASFNPSLAIFKTALLGISPNPFKNTLKVAFRVGSDGVRSLQFMLFDELGRTVLNKNIGETGPGRNVVTLAGRNRLAAGMYVLRMIYSEYSGSTATLEKRIVCLP